MNNKYPEELTQKQNHQQHLIFTAILTGDTHHLDNMHDSNNDLHVATQFLTTEWQKTQTPQTQTRHMIDALPYTEDRQKLAQKYAAHIHNNPYPPSEN